MRSQPLPLRLLSSFVALTVAFAPSAVVAQESAVAPMSDKQRQSLAVDVALQPEGMLIGQLVASTGKPQADAEVKLMLADGREAVAKTNKDGGFAFKGVRGVAHLQTDNAAILVRSWAPGAAPPSATPAVLLIEGQDFVRGQRPAGPVAQGFVSHSKRLLANPLFVAGVVGTAVAIPVAIHNADDDDPAS